MVRAVVSEYPELPDEVFISCKQENLETIHQHNVIAERYGTLGEIRAELEHGQASEAHTSRRAWLDQTR
jgi:GTP cyclohydrolase IV